MKIRAGQGKLTETCLHIIADTLMGQIAKRVEDKRLLKLIRAFLNAGVMENGLVSPAWKEPRKEDRFRHCSVTSCSTNSTASWSAEDTVLYVMRTTVTFTFVANARVIG
jgi:hypothetical protein